MIAHNPSANRRGMVLDPPQKSLNHKHSVGELKTINIDISNDYAAKPHNRAMHVRASSKLSQPS